LSTAAINKLEAQDLRPPTAPQENTMRLRRREDGRLLLRRGESDLPVELRRCFPWTDPDRFFSLRDDEEREVAMIESAEQLGDDESRAVLAQAARETGFVFRITAIESIATEFEIRVWSVQTEQGPRTFQTALDEWPRDVPGGGLLIRDVAGDLFHIANPDALDALSQKKLWAFVD
jgi:hypothetical protein